MVNYFIERPTPSVRKYQIYQRNITNLLKLTKIVIILVTIVII